MDSGFLLVDSRFPTMDAGFLQEDSGFLLVDSKFHLLDSINGVPLVCRFWIPTSRFQNPTVILLANSVYLL